MLSSLDAVLEAKGHNVYSRAASATIADAVIEMCRVKVGALLVMDELGAPVGILSERDLMVRVLLHRRDPASTLVGDVMTRRVICIEGDRTVAAALALMTFARCRHLPVVHEGKVVGLVSIGDLVRLVSSDQEYELRILHEYVAGKYPG
jgi:CBS domain-containing protein